MTGRQMSWSVATMMAIMVSRPQAMARVISSAGGGLQIGAEAGEAEVVLAQHEHLAGHEEEPAAGDGDHRVPDQADGGVGKLKLDEALPAGEFVDLRRFAQLAGNALDGGVEAEGHVPDLAGEDEDNRTHLQADLAGRKERDHGEHDAGKKAEHRDRLQDIEARDHEGFHALAVGGDVAVADGEEEAEQVGEADADDGVKGVAAAGRGG